ncbi:glucodextranase DOMON-like domain-containing protein [Actinomadura sp. DC4]|uniref:glucodextranase DOMON-like domain-containing protein n=1 Tax=Actinomadura sp. DC4 TaxID=3055069 RepID=UPI0025B09DF3|nr:glucodextranase DOMON-like domain-containing protein [Actinomadura sp. DC4]MDN3352249.1 glucodextranase DOMON-like domain-containing protein [Actinomadura sp. DC4]
MRRPHTAVLAVALTVPLVAAIDGAAHAAPAAGGPGTAAHFDLARKDCVGTAHGGSKIWFTVAGGVLSDVYEPTIDNTNVESMRFVVTDGRTFTELQGRDTTYTVRTDPTGMACTVTTSSKAGRYRLVTTYVTDPRRDAVVIRTSLQARTPLRLYVRLDTSVNGNGGGGTANAGADSGSVRHGVPVVGDENTATSAANRDYAVPTHLALRASRPLPQASVGYVGTASDGAAMLDAHHTLAPGDSAPDGNVVATARLPVDDGASTFALGFGRTADQAIDTAGAAAARPFAATANDYANGWRAYDRGLRRPPGAYAGAYFTSANVIKASEDKTFPGAVVASLASPWGQALSAADASGGKPVYFGSYREVFSRDLYEAFTGFLTDGDLTTARATARFLLERQQLADGRLPRNSLLNGQVAPDTGGDQLDETAYPVLMAYQAGLGGDTALWRDHVREAADFLVSHGPSFGVERWEEQSGYSPSTIAAEIAGLVAGGEIADRHGDAARARLYRATADHYARSIKGWTVTTTGPYGTRYFLRLSKNGDPDAATTYGLGNGGPTEDQRRVLDAGFLELTRLGVLAPDDPDVTASLPILDRVIGRATPTGRGWYRYGSDTSGTEDGYGDCHVADPTSCEPEGRPWPTGNAGSGHVWPVLSGERAEHDLQVRDQRSAAALLTSMSRYSPTGLVPEQAWEDPDAAASPYGTDPANASIGFVNGQAAGSASPLTWAQAQVVRLALDLGAARPLEQPKAVRDRYTRAPGTVPLTLTGPADGASVSGTTVQVTGTTTPGAVVDVASAGTDVGSDTSVTSARSDGTFSATVPVSFGTTVLTVSATDHGRTAYAQRTVVGELTGGTTALDVTDPDGDDNGPGTYAYPTAADFHAGAYDIERFQVISDANTVYLQARLRDLTPTFGSPIGAQLLDVYVRQPGVSPTSSQAASAQRVYTLGDAWTQRIEVQGFASPVWVDAAGSSRGGAAVRSSQTARTITIALPKATFGTPGTGWEFAAVLHGQDGFSSDQARGFAPTAQPYAFGVCGPDASGPICAADPATVPRAMDVITPPGVSQADELDPTKGPATIRSVSIP